LGGKSHALVVDLLGVAAGLEGQADDRVLVHPGQPAGLADADAFLDVSQDGDGFIFGQAAVEQGGALALTEAVLAATTGQTAPPLGGAVAEGDAEVALTAPAVVRALGVLAAEALEVVHGVSHRKKEQVVAITLPLL
jgi:hypothetical protein